MRRTYISARARLGFALGASSLACIGLFLCGIWINNDTSSVYLIWNLFLAWVALLMALWLERTLSRRVWSSWYALFVTLLWAIFLPNSFYIVTDLIHIPEVGKVDLLYDVIMFTSFVFTGVMLGILSLYIVHKELCKRLSPRTSFLWIEAVILVCSFAIYIGRELRWNTWDVFLNPLSLLFDVSDRILNPAEHPFVITTTLGFFVLISLMYGSIWSMARAVRQSPSIERHNP